MLAALFRRNLPASLLSGVGALWFFGSLAGGLAQEQAKGLGEPAHSAWLDLRPAVPGSEPQTVPAWVEALEFVPAKAGAASSVARFRLRRPADAGEDLQVRVFFQDAVNASDRPRVTAWDEVGTKLLDSGTLGFGLGGLASSQTLTVPMRGVNYLEIEAPAADGAALRGVFLTWLVRRETREPVDFPVGTAEIDAAPGSGGKAPPAREPFRILPATPLRSADGYVYGVVTAALQAEPVPLTGAGAGSGAPGGLLLEFDLERPPLLALLTYEVLSGSAVSAPPQVFVNGQGLGGSDLFLPDLADPGFRGEAQSAPGAGGPVPGALTFRYTGWLRAQKAIPAPALTAGLNKLVIQLSNEADSAAVRAVEIQLKYSWEKLDYSVSPAAGSPTYAYP